MNYELRKISDRNGFVNYYNGRYFVDLISNVSDYIDDFIFDMLRKMYLNYRSKRAFKEEIMNVLSPKNKQRFYELIGK